MGFIKFIKAKRPAFTLIEALTVVAIIGILASITLYVYQGYQSRLRDAKRKSDLTAISLGLQARYQATACSKATDIGIYPGVYPPKIDAHTWTAVGNLAGWGASDSSNNPPDSCGPFSEFLSNLPDDPATTKKDTVTNCTEDTSNCQSSIVTVSRPYLFNISTDLHHYRLAAALEKTSQSSSERDKMSNDWVGVFGGKGYGDTNSLNTDQVRLYNYFIGN